MNTRKMKLRQNEQGVAVIVAVGLAVSLVMIATALLSTTRRHTDTARAYKQADILLMALLSAKASAISDGAEAVSGVYIVV